MRITIDLSNFFSDHRRLSKILISEKIKKIKDIENRITKIFQIDNLHLTIDKCYLPSFEDVEILNADDLVCVVPNIDYNADDELESKASSTVEERKAKKKKKEIKQEKSGESFRKKRKRKYEEIENDVKTENNGDEKSRNSCSSGLDSGISQETCQNHTSPSSVKSLVDLFENKDMPYSSKDAPQSDMETHLKRKRINIVKTIIISNGNVNNKTNNCEESSQLTIKKCPSPIVLEDNVKLRRKGVRKRKHVKKDKDFCPVLEIPVISTPIFKPISVSNCNQHLRFEDEEPIKEQTPELPSTSNDLKKDNNIPKEENVSIIKEKLESKDENAIYEEFIQKQPITKNIQPRLDDVIAFKILRISENYTPEVSSTIVGRVKSYNITGGDEIIFEILYGQDQCVQPSGKFSLDTEITEIENTPSNEFESNWSALMEPRLLYP